MNEPQSSQRKVSVEDLLHFKRAERPNPAFWSQFEQEMRAKQLSALVRKDPWWRSLPRVLTRTSRLHLPLGATAVFALALVTVREVRQSSKVQVNAPVSPAAAPVVVVQEQSNSATSSTAINSEIETVPLRSESFASVTPSSELAESTPSIAREEEIQTSVGNSRARVASLSEPSLSARSIAANLAAAEASEPQLAQLIESARGFENIFASDRSPSVEPLTQVTTPRDTRRARLLASAVPADQHSPETSAARSRDRITSHLREESLYDSITRLGLNANRVSIKF